VLNKDAFNLRDILPTQRSLILILAHAMCLLVNAENYLHENLLGRR
jgi:hypothetical protein